MKRIFTILLLVTLWIRPVHADVQDGFAPQNFSYLFHLYFSNGQLFADRDFQYKYDILASAYQAPTVTTEFPYRGDILNFSGQVGAHFVFDPRQGDIHFTEGKLSVTAPYVADGDRAVFYDSQNNPLLTISISQSSYCNDDGICNADNGEDSLSCPKDCKQTLPAPPPTQNQQSGSNSSGIISGLLYAGAGVVVIIGYWWYRRRAKGAAGSPPDFVMPPTMVRPTPPVPPSPSAPAPESEAAPNIPAPTSSTDQPSTPSAPPTPQNPV
ncbi:MAG TPA: hypothetical protein VG941_02775 [Candidatus Paceibacterota bacterium]|nr:hypothetical protein [Candidatus Paceibacterota bacterium]